MDIGEIVSDSIKYPLSDWTKIIILAVIMIIPIVNFIGIGYLIRMLKATLAGLDDLPEFDEIGDMFIDGLKVLVIGIVYAIPIWIIAAIFGFIIGAIMPTATTDVSTAGMVGMSVGYIIFLIVALIVGLIEVIAIVNMAYNDSEIGAAFRFSEILDLIARIGWGKYILTYIVIALISIVIMVVAYIVGIILLFVGIILLFVGMIITVPLAISFIYMFGSRALALLCTDAIAEAPE